MAFQDILAKACSFVPGSQAAVLMNMDGLVVARHDQLPAQVDLEALLVELVGALSTTRQASEQQDSCRFVDTLLDLGAGALAVRMLPEDHFVAMWLGEKAIPGRARWALRLVQGELASELQG